MIKLLSVEELKRERIDPDRLVIIGDPRLLTEDEISAIEILAQIKKNAVSTAFVNTDLRNPYIVENLAFIDFMPDGFYDTNNVSSAIKTIFSIKENVTRLMSGSVFIVGIPVSSEEKESFLDDFKRWFQGPSTGLINIVFQK